MKSSLFLKSGPEYEGKLMGIKYRSDCNHEGAIIGTLMNVFIKRQDPFHSGH